MAKLTDGARTLATVTVTSISDAMLTQRREVAIIADIYLPIDEPTTFLAASFSDVSAVSRFTEVVL